MAPLTCDASVYELDCVPEGLLACPPEHLHRVLPGPTLIHLEGRVDRPLFVSALLHGNETTGLHAVQRLLRKYAERTLPRALSLFLGNIAATREGQRRLGNQVDYNRIWPGTELPVCPETIMAQSVIDRIAPREPFASVDVHNNTGLNPHYSCVERLDPQTLQLAAMFGRLCIYSTHPKGTLSAAFAELCPSVTVECGKPGQSFGIEHALEYLEACLHLTALPAHPVAPHDLELYESVAQVFVDAAVEFGFDAEGAALNFIADLDHLNFTPVPAGFMLGRSRTPHLPLQVINGSGRDVASEYFAIKQGYLMVRKPVMPSMLTTDARIVRQDCLGYLMERRE